MNELQAIQQIFKSSRYIHDLDFGDVGEFSAKAALWHNDCDICLIYSHGKPNEKPNIELFSQAFGKIENALTWLDTHKSTIAKHFEHEVLDGLNGWVIEEIAKEGKAVIDGINFDREITLDEFSNSLFFLGVDFHFVKDDDVENMNYYFTLATDKPDFLFEHIATVEVENGELCSGICIDG